MKKLIGKFKIGEMMSKILLLTILVAFVLFTGLLGNKKATAQSGMPYHCDDDACIFTGDTLIYTTTQFDNKNIIIDSGAVVTLDGEHTFKDITINNGTLTHSPTDENNQYSLSPNNFGVRWTGYINISSKLDWLSVRSYSGQIDGGTDEGKITLTKFDDPSKTWTGTPIISEDIPAGLYAFEIFYLHGSWTPKNHPSSFPKPYVFLYYKKSGIFGAGGPVPPDWYSTDPARTQVGKVNGEYYASVYSLDESTWANLKFNRVDTVSLWDYTGRDYGLLLQLEQNESPFEPEPVQGLKLTADNIMIGSSGKIDVSGKGYPGGYGEASTGSKSYGYGPGGGVGYPDTASSTYNVGGGGSYGGIGSLGYPFDKTSAHFPPYYQHPAGACCKQNRYGFLNGVADNLIENNDNSWYGITYIIPFGSGGGGGFYEKDNTVTPDDIHRQFGGAGGGLLKITAETITLENGGAILANGANGQLRGGETDWQETTSAGGGGSGGTIEIHALEWTNSNLGSPEVKGDDTRKEAEYVDGVRYTPFWAGMLDGAVGDGTIWVGSSLLPVEQATDPAVIAQYKGSVKTNGGLLGGGGGRIAIDAPIGEAPTPPVSADSRKVKAVITWQEFGKTQTVELWTYLKDVR